MKSAGIKDKSVLDDAWTLQTLAPIRKTGKIGTIGMLTHSSAVPWSARLVWIWRPANDAVKELRGKVGTPQLGFWSLHFSHDQLLWTMQLVEYAMEASIIAWRFYEEANSLMALLVMVFFCIRNKRIWSGNIWIEWVRFCPSWKVGWVKWWARPGCCCQAMCCLAAK